MKEHSKYLHFATSGKPQVKLVMVSLRCLGKTTLLRNAFDAMQVLYFIHCQR